MSENVSETAPATPPGSGLRPIPPWRNRLFYALAIGAALFEAMVLWMAMNPTASPDYRAYYIDKTTTCLNQPRSGEYRFGDTISFRSDGVGWASIRVCGWEGPAGDGLHAVGETARLRFLVGTRPGPLRLDLGVVAIEHEDHPSQTLAISVNGHSLPAAVVPSGGEHLVTACLPAGVVGVDGLVDVVIDFPDAIRMAPGDTDARKRSIKLVSGRVSTPVGNCTPAVRPAG